MPVDVVALSTVDPDVAHRTLNELFVPDRPAKYFGTSQRLRFAVRSLRVPELQTGWVVHSMATRAEVQPFSRFVASMLVSGLVHWQSGRQDFSQGPGDVVCYPTTAASMPQWTSLEGALVCIPMSVVDLVANVRTGIAPGLVRFDDMRPVSPAMGRHWRALTRFVHQSLAAPDSAMDNELVRLPMAEFVATTALNVFPNATMTLSYTAGPGWVPSAAMRRAVVYVEEHAGEPVSLADIAEAARLSPRALQAAFRQHGNTTPMGYVRRVRLDRAHRELQSADPTKGDSVASVAARWGFRSAGRFTTQYRAQFGVLPSHTLRN